MKTYTYRIHPGIGIARVGNSPEEYYLGPEAPGIAAAGPYKDNQGRVARQAVRFRVFRYTYDDGELSNVREVTNTSKITIHWTVHLSNKKSAAAEFPPMNNESRNRNVHSDERNRLIIDAGNQAISGADQSKLLTGAFMNHAVQLGDLKTDEAGRLIALGGFGNAASVPPGRPLVHFANNDSWHDDTSDGPVTAAVEVESGTDKGFHTADPAWLVVAPPGFVPGLQNMVTWYDRALEMAIAKDSSFEPDEVSFSKHIFPILSRIVKLQWVDEFVASGHSALRPEGNFLNAGLLEKLASNKSEHKEARERVLERVRIVGDPNNFGDMPRFENRGLDPDNPQARVPPSLTNLQIKLLKAWAIGKFKADFKVQTPPKPKPLNKIKSVDLPIALDRAALEDSIGEPFFPGIECGYIMARPETYDRPFRISRKLSAGDLTSGLAVPWQADFYECRSGFESTWWPAARPNQIHRNNNTTPVSWVPDWFEKKPMVDNWWKLGFILKKEGDERYSEELRSDELDHIA
ncbi:MAG: LodA/GoxA family CTQ-dependent oxidase [Anderseniella sp.]